MAPRGHLACSRRRHRLRDGSPSRTSTSWPRPAAANPRMIRYPIPPMIHGGRSRRPAASSPAQPVLAPEFDAARGVADHRQAQGQPDLLHGRRDGPPDARRTDRRTEGGQDYDLSTLYVLASTCGAVLASIKEEFLELLPNRVITDSIGSSETGFGGTGSCAKGADAHRRSAGQDRRLHRRARRGRQRGRTRIGRARHASPQGQHPARLLQGPGQDGRNIQDVQRRSLLDPRRLRPGRSGRHRHDAGPWFGSINSGGEKIYPEEVEGALKGHPDVFDALVVGVPDERCGQRVAAVVQRREGTARRLPKLTPIAHRDRRIQGAAQSVVRRRDQAHAGRQARLPLGQGPDGRASGRRRAREHVGAKT